VTNAGLPAVMKRETFAIANIYVPVKRRATLDPKKAQEIAESILRVGLQSPILVRQANVSSWWKGCIVWRRASNSARKPSSDMSCRPAGIDCMETLDGRDPATAAKGHARTSSGPGVGA
jgi:hypothetical protein